MVASLACNSLPAARWPCDSDRLADYPRRGAWLRRHRRPAAGPDNRNRADAPGRCHALCCLPAGRGQRQGAGTVLPGITIDGLPADRHRAILGWAIESRDAFLRYLRLLLADLGDPFAAQLAAKQAGKKRRLGSTLDDQPILEDMVRALTHGPDRLRALGRLMERLGDSAGTPRTARMSFRKSF